MSTTITRDEPGEDEIMRRVASCVVSVLPNLIFSASDAIDHRSREAEDIVYHYTSASDLMRIVNDNSLSTTSMGFLNDTSEYTLGIKIFEETITDYIENYPLEPKAMETIALLKASLQKRNRNDIFIACFSTELDDLGQWRGYAANGYGYAIGFEVAQFGSLTPAQIPFNVLYNREKQQQFCVEFLRQGMPAFAKGLHEAGLEVAPQAVAQVMSFAVSEVVPMFKHSGFKDEKEFRLVVLKDRKAVLKYHDRNGILIPHIPLWPSETKKLPIREIIVGPNLNFEQAKWSLKRFLEQSGYEDFEIKPSNVPYLA